MKKTILSSLAIMAIMSLSGCGGTEVSDTKSAVTKKKNESVVQQKTGDEDVDNNYQDFASITGFNTTYKGSVSSSDKLDWYVLEDVKEGNEYYFHLINKGDSNTNPATTRVKFSIHDGGGKIKSGELDRKWPEKTYKLVPTKNGKLYIKFEPDIAGSRYQFDIKTGISEGLEHNSSTYEYNDFKKVAYPISLDTTYKSSVVYPSDVNDWFVLDNADSSKEYYFHLKNHGDKSTNSVLTRVQFSIYDGDGKIKSGELDRRWPEKTYTFEPLMDGKVYIQIFADDVQVSGRYEFDIKAH